MYDAPERSVRGFKRWTYTESSGQATTHTIPCPMDQANQSPFGEKSTLHVSHPARPSKDGGRLVFSSRRRVGSDAGGRAAKDKRRSLKKGERVHPPPEPFVLSSPLDVCPGSAAAAWLLGQTLTRRWWLRIFLRGAHRRRLHMLVPTVRWPLASGEGWVTAPTRPRRAECVRFLLCDSPWTIGSCCPTSSRFCHYVTMVQQATPLGNKRNDRVQ